MVFDIALKNLTPLSPILSMKHTGIAILFSGIHIYNDNMTIATLGLARVALSQRFDDQSLSLRMLLHEC